MDDVGNTTPMMSSSELARYLSVSERTINQWAAEGKVPASKVVSSWRFDRGEIDAWLKDNHFGPSYVEGRDGGRTVVKKTRWKLEKEYAETEKAILSACSAYIMTTIEESTKSMFALDMFKQSFDAEIVNKTVNDLKKQKKLKLNKKFKNAEGNIITVVERKE